LIIISQSSAHRLVVHVWFVLVEAPESGHGLAVDQLEDPLLPVDPLDVGGTAGGGLEEGQEELPEVGAAWVLRLLLGSLLLVLEVEFDFVEVLSGV